MVSIQKQSPRGVLKIFAKFTGKHLCQGLVFNKFASLRPATLFKKRLWHRCFPVNFAKFLRTLSYRTALVAASVHFPDKRDRVASGNIFWHCPEDLTGCCNIASVSFSLNLSSFVAV